MLKTKYFWWLLVWVLVGCGPDTIFLRPGLDTSAQHLSNGNIFLHQKKYEAAQREFQRAIELDPRYTDAHVALGLAYVRQGDFEKGRQSLDHAKALAKTEMEWDNVQNAFDELRRLEAKSKIDPPR
ncbi:MAG: tetratricopeptide repeat protein [Desulfobacteraceae bacterium]|nr:tetratricopeptide repeat protein [Desulfobacteraceae bacterium]